VIDTEKPVTLHHLDPGTLFRDRDALWKVCEGGDSGKIHATRIASLNVNNTGELMFREGCLNSSHIEHYNAYNEVILVAGIYEVVSDSFRSPALKL